MKKLSKAELDMLAFLGEQQAKAADAAWNEALEAAARVLGNPLAPNAKTWVREILALKRGGHS
jgi:hypothetical protein